MSVSSEFRSARVDVFTVAAALVAGILAISLLYSRALDDVTATSGHDALLGAAAALSGAPANARGSQGEMQRILERHRLRTTTGRGLQRDCFAWSQVYSDQPGEIARERRDEACHRFQRYVAYGP